MTGLTCEELRNLTNAFRKECDRLASEFVKAGRVVPASLTIAHRASWELEERIDEVMQDMHRLGS